MIEWEKEKDKMRERKRQSARDKKTRSKQRVSMNFQQEERNTEHCNLHASDTICGWKLRIKKIDSVPQ